MDARRTPDRPVPGVPYHSPDPTLERGYVASLRWLVAEGEARGLRRLAVELCALREALTTLDETRRARDEQAERARLLDQEVQDAQRMLGEATHVNGNGSLVARLTKLRDTLGRDIETRKTLVQERDTWRAMCELQTRTRAMVHALLEESEHAREALERERDIAASDARNAAGELAALRLRLHQWSGTIDRALQELARAQGAMRIDSGSTPVPPLSDPSR